MRAGRVVLIVIGAIILVTAVTLLAVRLSVNPNDYKARIAAAVKRSTGRDLELEGDLKLTVFPWIGLELGRARLGNTPGFGPAPLAAVQGATLRVRLLPLLARRLVIGRIEIDGLDLNLQRNAAGRGNWLAPENAGASETVGDGGASGAPAPTTATAATAAQPGPRAARGTPGMTFEGLAGLSLVNARVTYQQSVLENLDFEIGRVAEGGADQYQITKIAFSGALQRPGAGHDVAFKLAAPQVDLDLAAGTLSLPTFTSDIAGALISGALHGTQILDAPVFTGAVTLAPLGLRAFMDRLGMAAVPTRDPAALSQLEGSFDLSYGEGALQLSKLVIVLDQTRLTGGLSITAANDAIRFDLSADHLNVDHYLKPVAKAGQAEPVAAGGAAVSPVPAMPPMSAVAAGIAETAPASGAATPGAPAPGSALKTLDAAGTLAIGSLIVAGLDFTKLSATLNARDGVARLSPVKAALYGGAYTGELTLDVRGETPAIALEQHVSGVDVARLLADSLKSHRLSGRGTLGLTATAHGADAESVLQTLSGHADAYLAQGALEGVDLWHQVSVAEALLTHQSMPTADNAKRTPFDTAKFTAAIDHGVATTKDLTIASGLLRVAGQGSANLVTEGIDFHVTASILNAARSASQAEIPVAITGTLAAPTVRPDLQGLLKGQLKQKLQDTLKDKLKGFLGGG